MAAILDAGQDLVMTLRRPTGTTAPGPAVIPVSQLPDPNLGLLGAIAGGIGGFVTGGPAGAVAGAIAGYGGSEGPGGEAPTAESPYPGAAQGGNLCQQFPEACQGSPLYPLPIPFGGSSGPGKQQGTAMVPRPDASGGYMGGVSPSVETRTHRRCPRGMVLGDDGLCYRGLSRNSSRRMWPMGRKPLLTGGDLNAISRAASAAKKLKTQQKRLEKLGLLKKPSRRGSRSGPTPTHQLVSTTPGVQVISAGE